MDIKEAILTKLSNKSHIDIRDFDRDLPRPSVDGFRQAARELEQEGKVIISEAKTRAMDIFNVRLNPAVTPGLD